MVDDGKVDSMIFFDSCCEMLYRVIICIQRLWKRMSMEMMSVEENKCRSG